MIFLNSIICEYILRFFLVIIPYISYQVKPGSASKENATSSEGHGLGDSDSDDEGDIMFDPIPLYKQILEYLKPGESVSKALCRLGKLLIQYH